MAKLSVDAKLVRKLAALLRETGLTEIEYVAEEGADDERDEMRLSDALLLLARIKHEQEWQLCRSVAEHLLGRVPEPDDADIGGD